MKAYVAIYEADGPDDCHKRLIFGEKAEDTEENKSEYSWKWVNLPCPKCGTTHLFKRSLWYEDLEIPE